MHRYRFVLMRPLQFLPVLFGISVITFVLVRLIPGDPARMLLGTRSTPAALTRSLRASLIAELTSDYATAARARGLSEGAVFWRHVLPNALVPVVNLLAVNIGWLIGGTVIVETVFAIPGMGQLLVRGIFSRDYMVVQGVAMTFAVATVLVNFAADILTVAIDPRVKM